MNIFAFFKRKNKEDNTPNKTNNLCYSDFNHEEQIEIISFSLGIVGNTANIKLTPLHCKEARLYFENKNPDINRVNQNKIISLAKFSDFEKTMIEIFNSSAFLDQLSYIGY